MPETALGLGLGDADRSLLVAALGQADAAPAAWEAWARETTLDRSPAAAFPILPTVSRNLDRLGVDHADSSKLRGIRRYAWTQCQLTIQDLRRVLEALDRAGVQAVTHRGVPTASRVLGDAAGVLVDQTDLLIDPAELDAATAALRSRGWDPATRVPPSSIRSAFGWLPFQNAERRRVALHWRSFPAGSRQACDAGILERAGAHQVEDFEVRVPEATDHLLLLCMRAHTLADVERLRWALELCAVLGDTEPSVDEGALRARAEDGGVTNDCARVLLALEAFVGSGIPALRFPRLPQADPHRPSAWRRKRVPRGRLDRVRFAIRGAGERYVDWCRRTDVRATPWGLARFTARYYAYEWGARDARTLVTAAARRWRQGTEDLAPGAT